MESKELEDLVSKLWQTFKNDSLASSRSGYPSQNTIESLKEIVRASVTAEVERALQPRNIWAVKPGCPALMVCPDTILIGELGLTSLVSVPLNDSHFWQCGSMHKVGPLQPQPEKGQDNE